MRRQGRTLVDKATAAWALAGPAGTSAMIDTLVRDRKITNYGERPGRYDIAEVFAVVRARRAAEAAAGVPELSGAAGTPYA